MCYRMNYKEICSLFEFDSIYIKELDLLKKKVDTVCYTTEGESKIKQYLKNLVLNQKFKKYFR